MSDDSSRAMSASSRATTLAWVSILVWLAAAGMSRAVGVWPAIGGAAVLLGVAVVLFDRPAATVLLKPGLWLVLLGTGAGALMAAATYLLYPVFARLVPFIATDTARLYTAFRATSPLIASVVLVPVIVGEELVWRGVVQGSLVRRLGQWRGIILGSVVYALAHVPVGSPVLVAAAFFCGLVWGALCVRTASLGPALVAHMLWNALVLLWLPLDS